MTPPAENQQPPAGVAPALANHFWSGTVAQFCRLSATAWLSSMAGGHYTLYRRREAATQRAAWADCREVLAKALRQAVRRRPEVGRWSLVFEYELPWEGGRRPDLVLLAAGHVLVFEFKQAAAVAPAALDQVAAYARDLHLYHGRSQHFPVLPVLVPTRRKGAPTEHDGVAVVPPAELADLLAALPAREPSVERRAWLAADYAPLPNVVAAARRVFEREPLPDLRRAQSAGIPDVLAYLGRVADAAEAEGGRHVALLTGVPGAGKTLVGLTFVYRHGASEGDRRAVFLTGNGPLVEVLQYALRSKVFVRPVRNFYLHHEVRGPRAPAENVIVFDEAQRAWDAGRMAEKYGIPDAAPGAVLRIAGRSDRWSVVVGLIGEGQEIHVGEEGGPGQWADALRTSAIPWVVHCPPRLEGVFVDLPAGRVRPEARLDLTLSLRTHRAEGVQAWIAHLLAGELAAARRLAPALRAAGFAAYLTRDLGAAKSYCRARYADEPAKTYGLLASSRARNLPRHGVRNDYPSTQRVAIGPWFVDPPDSPLSCRALADVATEFGCQGLELDMPVVCWGDDLTWGGAAWAAHAQQRNVRDPRRLRLNSYRVLLSRGRDGVVVFVPPEAQMDATYAAVAEAGAAPL